MTQYKYNSSDLVRGDMSALTERERFLLTESKTFCIYPWIHYMRTPLAKHILAVMLKWVWAKLATVEITH